MNTEELVALAKERNESRNVYVAMCSAIRPTGLTDLEQAAHDLAYSLAAQRWMRAEMAYNDAIRKATEGR